MQMLDVMCIALGVPTLSIILGVYRTSKKYIRAILMLTLGFLLGFIVSTLFNACCLYTGV